jgi:hypothetical protein
MEGMTVATAIPTLAPAGGYFSADDCPEFEPPVGVCEGLVLLLVPLVVVASVRGPWDWELKFCTINVSLGSKEIKTAFPKTTP